MFLNSCATPILTPRTYFDQGTARRLSPEPIRRHIRRPDQARQDLFLCGLSRKPADSGTDATHYRRADCGARRRESARRWQVVLSTRHGNPTTVQSGAGLRDCNWRNQYSTYQLGYPVAAGEKYLFPGLYYHQSRDGLRIRQPHGPFCHPRCLILSRKTCCRTFCPRMA